MKPKKIYDLSPTIGGRMPYYPGDAVFQAEPICTIKRSGCNMHRLVLGTHTGSHVDAPLHFVPHGESVDRLPLDRFVGEAEVVEVKGREIGPEAMEGLPSGTKRVLFKTRNSPLMREETFHTDYVHLTLEGARYLLKRGVELVGIDYVSIERFGTPDFTVHKELLEAEVAILEGLDLSQVPPGRYFLVALPLKLRGMDGSPLRAVLLEL